MSDRNAVAWRVASLRGRWLDLTLAGRVFGGRPGEAPLRVAESAVDGAALRLTFDGGERLTVLRPSGVAGGAGVLLIRWAAEVRLAWRAPGASARVAEGDDARDADRCEVVCAAADDAPPGPADAAVVRVTVSGPARESWSPQGVLTLRPGEPLVRLE